MNDKATGGVIDAEVVAGERAAAVESTALEVIANVHDSLIVRREPTVVLAEAHRAAAALAEVINGKPKKVMFNGEQYLENEDWQTVAHFYGVTAKIESDSFVQFGSVQGFEAVAIVVDRTGREIGRAIAMCLNDEENWGPRPKYEWHYKTKDGKTVAEDPGKDQIVWVQPTDEEKKAGKKSRPDKVRVQVADEPTPLFQLRSMAQTRACSKALRSVLGFVPVLAGYRPTPAEELGKAERVENDAKPAGSGATVDAKPRSKSGGNGSTQQRTGPADADLSDATTSTTQQTGSATDMLDDPNADIYTPTRLVELKKGENANGPWVLYGIETKEIGANQFVSTLDKKLAKVAFDASKSGGRVRMLFTVEQKGQYTNRTLTEIAAVA